MFPKCVCSYHQFPLESHGCKPKRWKEFPGYFYVRYIVVWIQVFIGFEKLGARKIELEDGWGIKCKSSIEYRTRD